MKYTGNYNLKKPEGSDVVNIEDLNDNADIIDQALKAHDDALATKETTAGAQAKANTAEANAKAYTDAHELKAAPHSGHETPAGAQAKAEAAAGAVQAELDAHLADNVHLGKNEGAKIIRSTNQSLSSSWYRDIEFESVVFDRGNLFDASDKTKLTVPSDGIYLAIATCVFAPSSAGHGDVCFKINGSRDYSSNITSPDFSEYESTTITLSAIYNLNQGDFIGVSAVRSLSGSDITRSSLTLIRVG